MFHINFLVFTTIKTTWTTKKTTKTTLTTEKTEITMKSETTETKTVMLTTESLISDETTYETFTEINEDEDTTKIVSQGTETSIQLFR